MRRSHLLLTGLLLTACDPASDASKPHQPRSASTGTVAPRIGMLSGPGSCDLGGTVPTGWDAAAQFGAGPQVPAGLRRFCKYDWAGVGVPGMAAINALRDAVDAYPTMDLDTFGADTTQVTPQSPMADAIDGPWRDAFRQQIGSIDAIAMEVGVVGTPVDVAILDSVGSEPSVPPAGPHGSIMAGVIADVICGEDSAACADRIFPSLALPQAGGNLGRATDLATAVYQSVEDWRARQVTDPEAASHLVINLSLGFEGDGTDTAHVAALKSALQYASCQGALVIGAAGNGDAGDEGPMLPGAWESLPAPEAASCESQGFGLIGTTFGGDGRTSLVYSVGGVDGYDEPLSNVREGGRPRLAATGIGPATGSSVSTAVVSGTAALVWQLRPDLSPEEVMDFIYDSGFGLGETADYGLDGTTEEIKRVSVCAAVKSACEGQPDCPELSCEAEAPAPDGYLGPVSAAMTTVLADPATNVVEYDAGPPSAPVSEDAAVVTSSAPVCRYCAMLAGQGGEDIVITLDPELAHSVVDASVVVSDAADAWVVFDLDEEMLSSFTEDDTLVVHLDTTGTRAAAVRFDLADGTRFITNLPIL